YTHEQIARKLGRSRTSVTEILSLNRMPQTVKDACRRADITAKSTLMEIVRQPDEATMLALVAAVSSEALTRDEVRERKKDAAGAANAVQRLRPFVFRYKPRDRDFSLSLKFDRETVEPTDLIRTLEGIIADLRDDLANGRPLAPEAKGAGAEAQV
ncbi:MAG TPA: KorB domain-containing protein, partial [Acidobacteriota bacterium]|nr:KorB domain-containing protein [Acidobacteriota bacterium]